MSILIKGMEMPSCCVECEWHEYYGGDYDWVHACRRTGTMPIENAETERVNDCPLVEVPEPHGRLIDASYKVDMLFYDDEYEEHSMRTVTVEELLMAADNEVPTIIEAEGSENE